MLLPAVLLSKSDEEPHWQTSKTANAQKDFLPTELPSWGAKAEAVEATREQITKLNFILSKSKD
jgi:hypothetical protein